MSRTPAVVPSAGPGAWTPSPSVFLTLTPESDVSSAHLSSPTATSKQDAGSPAPTQNVLYKPRARLPTAPFPLKPFEDLLDFGLPTPSPEPAANQLTEPGAWHLQSHSRLKRKLSGPLDISSSPTGRDASSPTLQLPTSTKRVDPAKIPFDPQLQPIPLGASCKIVRYPAKGFGLQATRHIRRGEEVIRERPFITFDHPITGPELWERWAELPLREQALFLSFTGTIREELDRWVNIAETNCIGTCNSGDDDDDDDDDGQRAEDSKETTDQSPDGRSTSGLFEFICRINHSCSPNTRWYWDEETEQLVLIAYEHISLGEEITASYKGDDVLLSRSDRRTILENAFGFICTCSRCTLSEHLSSMSDARLERYRSIRELWQEDICDFAFDRGKALMRLGEAETILRQEGKEGWKGEVLEQRFYIYALWGQRALALEAGKAARRWMRLVEGKKRADSRDLVRLTRNPEEYQGWGVALRDNGGVLRSDDEDGQSDLEEHYGASSTSTLRRSRDRKNRRSRTSMDQSKAPLVARRR